jgi:hypothetical protein
MGHSLRRWGHGRNDSIGLNIRRVVACILARARGRDDRWAMLSKDEFGVPDRIFRDHLAHGDSASLAILIYTTRQALQTRRSQGDSDVLRSLSQFNIHDTLPALQHDFCALWNEVVLEFRNEGADKPLISILSETRHLFEDLHQGTNAAPSAPFTAPVDLDSTLCQPSSYPLCNAASHSTDLNTHAPVPNIPSLHTCMPQLGGLPSFSPRPTPSKKQGFSATSPDIVASCTMQGDTDTSDDPSNANLVHAAPQQTKETTAVPPTIVSDLPSSSIPTLALRSGVIPAEPPPSVESAVTQPDPVSHAGRCPYSSLTKAHSRTSLTSSLDSRVEGFLSALRAEE